MTQLIATTTTSTSMERAESYLVDEDKEMSPSCIRPTTSSASDKSAHDSSPTYEPLTASMSVDYLPPIRVRSEELQRSVSSPQVCR